MIRLLVKVSLTLLVVLAVAAAGLIVHLSHWQETKVTLPSEVIVEFKGGTGLSALAHRLAASGVINNANFFSLMVRIGGDYKKYQAGTYRFVGDVAPVDLETSLIQGTVYNRIVAQIAIPEGFRIREVIERLAAHGIGHIVEITNLSKNPNFLAELNIKATNHEGYLYPATYTFHKLPTAREALGTMVKTFWQNLPVDYESQVKAKGLSINDAVIFASLIESETRMDDERPLVSEVIWRRLNDKAPLGIDAALIYGIPDYSGDVTWANLADKKNLYNTRIYPGLPPTAIGAPSRKSLEAVLTPTNLGYYYYVLTPGQMRHHFSKTLSEHNLNVKKLVNASKRENAQDKGKN